MACQFIMKVFVRVFFFFFFAVQVWVCSTEMTDYYDHKVEKKCF